MDDHGVCIYIYIYVYMYICTYIYIYAELAEEILQMLIYPARNPPEWTYTVKFMDEYMDIRGDQWDIYIYMDNYMENTTMLFSRVLINQLTMAMFNIAFCDSLPGRVPEIPNTFRIRWVNSATPLAGEALKMFRRPQPSTNTAGISGPGQVAEQQQVGPVMVFQCHRN